MSDMLRVTGLSSGMDTDLTVKKLIEVEQIKIDKAEQEKQYMEWQKEDYREVSNILRGFQDEYFDVLNPVINMKSSSSFNMFSGTATVDGVSSSAVSIATTSSSLVRDFTINSIDQLATKDSYVSSEEAIGNIISDPLGNITALEVTSMSFEFDGVSKTIELDESYADNDALIKDMSEKLQEEFTNVDIIVTENAGALEFNIYEAGTVEAIAADDLLDPPSDPPFVPTSETGHTLIINTENTALGLTAGESNNVNVYKSLNDVFDIDGNSSLTINGSTFNFEDTTTIEEMMDEINSSSAGVTLLFDSFTDKFSLESNKVGSDSMITVSESNVLMQKMNLVRDEGSALNAKFVVNNVATTRSDNKFEINGTSVTLNEVSTEAINIDITSDTTDVKDMIVKFVESYNEMISKITDLTSTRKNYDYDPLTDDQKEAMTDDDIETWQAEARKGTLSDDSALKKITSSLRTLLYESVEGVGINLYDIGITTSANYRDQGKLVINETKLDAALKDSPNEVIELFTKQSDITYASFTDRSTRNSENGISYRIFDVLQDNIRITRNDDGNKGYLIEKAGMDTGLDINSDMAKKLIEMDEKINDLLEMLGEQEEKYYTQFARMESAMSSYTSQSDFLASQFGG